VQCANFLNLRYVATITFLQPENFSFALQEIAIIALQKILIIANKRATWNKDKPLLTTPVGWTVKDEGIWRRNG